MRRALKAEREAARLAEAFASAEARLPELDERLSSVEEDAVAEIGRAAAALGLGEWTREQYEECNRAAEARIEEARTARATAARVVEALRPLAADARSALSREEDALARAEVAREAAELAAAERLVEERRAGLAAANRRHAIVQRQAADARAVFEDPEAVETRRLQDEEAALWHAQRPSADDRIPAHLRERVVEIRAALTAADEAAKDRDRLAAERQREEIHADGLRPHESFPRLRMPGDPAGVGDRL